MRTSEVLIQALATGLPVVTIPREVAAELAGMLVENDQVEIAVNRHFPQQMRTLFFYMLDRAGSLVTPSEVSELIGVQNKGAIYMAMWRLRRLVAEHLPTYEIESVYASGWVLGKVSDHE